MDKKTLWTVTGSMKGLSFNSKNIFGCIGVFDSLDKVSIAVSTLLGIDYDTIYNKLEADGENRCEWGNPVMYGIEGKDGELMIEEVELNF